MNREITVAFRRNLSAFWVVVVMALATAFAPGRGWADTIDFRDVTITYSGTAAKPRLRKQFNDLRAMGATTYQLAKAFMIPQMFISHFTSDWNDRNTYAGLSYAVNTERKEGVC